MKYVGSKNRLAKYILPFILKNRQSEEQWYVEPFVGGANLIDKVTGNRLGNDINPYLISLLIAIRDGWIPPESISEEKYNEVKDNKDFFPKELVGYIGFNSFGGKFFGGYCRNKDLTRDYWLEAKSNLLKQSLNLKGIIFTNLDYRDMEIPNNSIIYCDPPYSDSVGYGTTLHYGEYYQWCRKQKELGHHLFISDYSAPSDFKFLWEKKVTVPIALNKDYKKNYEKLFTL